MLDDRTVLREPTEQRLRVWNRNSNRMGWQAHLGTEPGHVAPALAAPARYEELAGLPPAWIGVGTNDLFHDEDLAYAARLEDAGVRCTLHVVHGAYHAFDLVERWAPVARSFREAQIEVLRTALLEV